MNNTEIEKVAQRALNKIQPKEGEYTFVITVLMIISIILTCIRIIQECNKSKTDTFGCEAKNAYDAGQLRSILTKRSWFSKMKLKKIIRQELGKDLNKEYGSQVLESLLSTGDELKDEELYSLVEATNG